MNLFEKLLIALQIHMPKPTFYGWFHLLSILLCLTGTIVIISLARNVNEKSFRRIVLVCWLTVAILEIAKQLIGSVNNENGQAVWSYSWHTFPFQLCSTQLYLLPFVVWLKDCKFRDSIISFLATFSLFGGLLVYIYPRDVFTSSVYFNIQTMIHHGTQIVLGIYFLVYYRQRLNWRYFAHSLPVFAVLLAIAMFFNILIYQTVLIYNGQVMNMFYISPYAPCALPEVENLIWPNAPYSVILIIYLIGIITTCALVFALSYYIIRTIQRRS